MKILCVSHEASLTGAPKIIFQIAKFLASRHQVILISKQNGVLLDEILAAEIPALTCLSTNTSYIYGRCSFSERVQAAQALIKEMMPDLVYVNSAPASEWVIAAKMNGIKTIFHLHEMEQTLKETLRTGGLTLDVMDYVDVLICASAEVKRDVEQLFPTRPTVSLAMEYPFDCDGILQLAQQEQPLPRNATGQTLQREVPIICSCGTAVSRKGVDLFFETARRLPQFQFLWVGRWKSDTEFKNPIEQQFLAAQLDNFFITDEVSNPYFYINLADLFVLTSREDPNPLVVMEALILNKQVICFSQTGGSRFILDRYGYLLTGTPDVDRLTALLKKLCPSKTIFQPSWLDSVPIMMKQKYDQEIVLPKFEKVIQDLIN